MIGFILPGILFILSCLFFLTHKRRRAVKENELPDKIKLVRHLLKYLNATKFSVSPSQKVTRIKVLRLTLKQIEDLKDNDSELASEEFEDGKIYFDKHKIQLLDLAKYLKSEILPKQIKEELRLFNNTSLTPVSLGSESYFLILTGSADAHIEKDPELYEGDGEAFESWLSFKESAQNLYFVINQWLKENHTGAETLTHAQAV